MGSEIRKPARRRRQKSRRPFIGAGGLKLVSEKRQRPVLVPPPPLLEVPEGPESPLVPIGRLVPELPVPMPLPVVPVIEGELLPVPGAPPVPSPVLPASALELEVPAPDAPDMLPEGAPLALGKLPVVPEVPAAPAAPGAVAPGPP